MADMSLNFVPSQATLTNTPTILYKNETLKPAIIVSGVFANTSEDTAQEHWLNLTLESPTKTTKVFSNIPVVFGSSITVPKITLSPGSSVSAWVYPEESSGLVDATLSVLEI